MPEEKQKAELQVPIGEVVGSISYIVIALCLYVLMRILPLNESVNTVGLIFISLLTLTEID
jgi:hypothetical protein